MTTRSRKQNCYYATIRRQRYWRKNSLTIFMMAEEKKMDSKLEKQCNTIDG